MNKKNMTNKVEEVKKDIEFKNLEGYYGSSNSREIREAYGFYNETPLEKLTIYLRATKEPKYVLLSNYLRQLLNYTSEDLKMAKAILSHQNYKDGMTDKEIKTTYREFKRIEKNSRKVKRNQARILNKYKDIKYFVKYDYNIVLAKLLNQKISIENTAQLINFFDSCEELSFLEDSKLVTKVK